MAYITINLAESDDFPATLREIAAQVEDGFTSGYHPYWNLSV